MSDTVAWFVMCTMSARTLNLRHCSDWGWKVEEGKIRKVNAHTNTHLNNNTNWKPELFCIPHWSKSPNLHKWQTHSRVYYITSVKNLPTEYHITHMSYTCTDWERHTGRQVKERKVLRFNMQLTSCLESKRGVIHNESSDDDGDDEMM